MKKDLYVAGGHVLHYVMEDDEAAAKSDLDVYSVDSNPKKQTIMAVRIMVALMNYYKEVPALSFKNQVLQYYIGGLKESKNFIKVEFIYGSTHTNLAHLFSMFDFGCCQMAYHENEIKMSPLAAQYMSDHKIYVFYPDDKLKKIRQMARYEKYSTRKGAIMVWVDACPENTSVDGFGAYLDVNQIVNGKMHHTNVSFQEAIDHIEKSLGIEN